VLYLSGAYRPEDKAAVALVGSRRPSSYGLMVATGFARALAEWGIVTVSGMAEGIDTRVHETTIDAGGRTVAVLGSGLGRLYPRENLSLSRRIRESGVVVSEFSMECPPYQVNFPRRNRLIAAFALGTTVVEAADRSGALITARLAAEQGKDVFAVPGMVNSPLSQGTHRLIQQGAKLVCSAREVVEEIEELKGLCQSSSPVPRSSFVEGENLGEFEKAVLSKLGHEPVQMDNLVQALGRKPQELSVSLITLEMKGFVQAAPGNAYVRIPRHR
jgi:DNA processing protein